MRDQLALPVLRALERVADPRTAPLLGDYLTHAEPLVRWHAIRIMAATNTTAFNDRLRDLAANDAQELVREAAALALERLEPLPPNLNN
jgi:HEAT repeat protein